MSNGYLDSAKYTTDTGDYQIRVITVSKKPLNSKAAVGAGRVLKNTELSAVGLSE